VSIFGHSILILIAKNELKEDSQKLKLWLKSFAIGLSLHLIYAVIIVYLQIFNFFTIYLPFIAFDICYLIYGSYKKYFLLSRFFKAFSRNHISKFIAKNKNNIIILVIAFFLYYSFQLYFINSFLSYSASDPFSWFNEIMHIHKYGFINYTQLKAYPPGFILSCSTMISFTNDYYMIYFFLKYLPVFILSINIFVVFIISKNMFDKDLNVIFTLLIYLGFNYTFQRGNMSLPSILASTLGFLYLLFIGEDWMKDMDKDYLKLNSFFAHCLKSKKNIFKGLLFFGITLMHPLYGLVYMIFYTLYEFYILLLNMKRKLNPNMSKIQMLAKFCINSVSIFIYFIIFMLPFLIGSYIHLGYSVITAYFLLIPDLMIFNPNSLYFTIFGPIFREMGVWIMKYSVYFFVYKFFQRVFFFLLLENFYDYTIQIGLIFIIVGIFIKFNKRNKFDKESDYLLDFIKTTFALSYLILALFKLFYFIEIDIFQSLYKFYYYYKNRVFELFGGYWALIFVFSFNYILFTIEKKCKKLKIFSNPSLKLKTSLKNLKIVLIVFTCSFTFLINIGSIEHNVRFNNYQAQTMLFVGDYFYDNPLNIKKGILLEDLASNQIYYLIMDENLEKNYYPFTADLNYSKFKEDFNQLNCEYVLFNKSNTNMEFIQNFTVDFDILYENIKGLFFAKRIFINESVLL
jgi:hypothetical protein